VVKKISIISALIIGVFLILGFTKDYYFKINKSFDVFGAIFREVTTNYVLEIDPEILIKGAINGMLATLDPYTEFYDVSDQDDFDILTSGTYTGFGISISNIDSLLTITEVRDGYSASEQGIRIGDRICLIDSIDVLYRNFNDVKELFKGTSGSKSVFGILRDGNPDTLRFELVRKQILLENISYYDMLDGSTAYIKLDRFNSTAAQDFRFALSELRRKNEMKSLIIDLRDNPGGLLEPAVQICELFLPAKSVIVTTRGRNGEELYSYNSSSNPVEPDLPLVVMINENSASASEILAGALQDYDRAVIVGRRSYGKGLVQSILPLPYKGNLKITTAKYYTPSGRCIQRIKFGEMYQTASKVSDSPDSTVYYTKNKRKVFESTGILPDTGAIKKPYSEIISELYIKFKFFNFANHYTSTLNKLPDNFKADDKLFAEFIKYLDEIDYSYQSESGIIIDRINVIAKESGYSKNFDKSINSLKKSLELEEKDIMTNNKSDILKYLDFEIRSRFLSEHDLLSKLLTIDDDLELAKKILQKGEFVKILSPISRNDY